MTTKKLQRIVDIYKDWLISLYLYEKSNETIPVLIVKEIDFVFLDSLRKLFVNEHFILLTQDDIHEGSDVFCLKLLHIKNHSTLFSGNDVLSLLQFTISDLRSAIELEIRNKRIQLREDYLSCRSGKEFLKRLVSGMQILWEWVLYLKHPSIIIPKDTKELLSFFDIALSCNSQMFYYLIDNKIEDAKISMLINDVHHYLSEVCTKINNFTL